MRVYEKLQAHVYKACVRHPEPHTGKIHLTFVLLEEVFEFLWALFFNKDPKRANAEAADVCAVLIRHMKKW